MFSMARVPPSIPTSQMSTTPSSFCVELSTPPHQPPPPSSSSAISSLSTPSIPSSLVHSTLDFDPLAPTLSGPCSHCGDISGLVPSERQSGQCSPHFLDVSGIMAKIPCLAVSVQVYGVGQADVVDSGLPGGSLICAFSGN
ncbi:hypothetical protein Nepgr_024025 [Nepenthes gracilis]|uniref:Uncharacterized protein n=1 Tax=Nepenthes gracilis TaxID=150966 RepID=A0AAD3XY85_NEPGR|nr:hypothetical protein Nepgr_024025 [Nepenthes gracilis]